MTKRKACDFLERSVQFHLDFVPCSSSDDQKPKKTSRKRYLLDAKISDHIPELSPAQYYAFSKTNFQSAIIIRNVPFFVDDHLLMKVLKTNSSVDASKEKLENYYSKLKSIKNLPSLKDNLKTVEKNKLLNLTFDEHQFEIIDDKSDLTKRSKYVLFELATGASECLTLLEVLANVLPKYLKFTEDWTGKGTYYCTEYQRRFQTAPEDLSEEVKKWLENYTKEEEQEKERMKVKVKRMQQGRSKPLMADEDEFQSTEASRVATGGLEDNEEEGLNLSGDSDGEMGADGWTVVTRQGKRKAKNKGVAFTVTNQQKLRPRQKKLLNFYSHQLNSKKARSETDLKARFERDKLIVAKMKSSNRKFNPAPK